MKRWLLVSTTIGLPAGQVVETLPARAEASLKATPGAALRPDGSIAVCVDEGGFGPFNPVLRVKLGVVQQRADGRAAIPLSWHADRGEFAFPHFTGYLEIEPLASSVTQLVIFGAYVPPLGPLGTAADAAVLHRAAEATARVLLEHIRVSTSEPDAAAVILPRVSVMTVRDVMTRAPFTLHPDLPLKTAALMLFHLRITGAPVVDDEGALLGVLTDRDLLDKEGEPGTLGWGIDAAWRRHMASTVGEACSRPARTTGPDVALRDAAAELRRHNIRRLVVVEDGAIAGIVTRRDVLKALIRTDEQLLEAVEAALEDAGTTTVTAAVEWGVVRLEGTLPERSQAAATVAAISDVDGVVHVESSIQWEVDDLAIRERIPPL